MELAIIKNDCLTIIEKIEIDKHIDILINKHKGNNIQINKLVFDSVTALETSNSYTQELESQGIVKRFFGGVSGKNRNIQSEIDKNLYKSQYSSQQTLQKLAEQNLMSFELITTVNNKLNSSIIGIENEINSIYGTLLMFFKQTKSNLIQIENRLDKLEQNVNILNWVNTIEYQMFNGIEYGDLNKIEKIVCLTTDFYSITKGNWTTTDLLLLKSAISEIGLSPKENIKYDEFIKYIVENEVLYNKLMDEDVRELENRKYLEASIISGISKYKLLDSNEEYIVNTVLLELNAKGISTNSKEVKHSLVKNYITQTNYIDIAKDVSLFDFTIELLLNIDIFEYIVNEKYTSATLDFNNIELETLKKYADRNNCEAQYYLGTAYLQLDADSGIGLEVCKVEGVDKDTEKALYYLNKSGKQGNSESQFVLGLYYQMEENENKAFELYKKSSDNGNRNSQFALGAMYLQGEVVDKNYQEALILFRSAAEKGHITSQYLIGLIYYNGDEDMGINQNYKDAFKWLMMSAEHGNTEAQYLIGTMYKEGKYVEKDYGQAFRWIKKSAEKGNDKAKEFLQIAF